jgi:hypothetical protein
MSACSRDCDMHCNRTPSNPTFDTTTEIVWVSPELRTDRQTMHKAMTFPVRSLQGKEILLVSHIYFASRISRALRSSFTSAHHVGGQAVVGYERTTADPSGSGCGPSWTTSAFFQVRKMRFISSHEQLRKDTLTRTQERNKKTTFREIQPFLRVDRRTVGTWSCNWTLHKFTRPVVSSGTCNRAVCYGGTDVSDERMPTLISFLEVGASS